MNRPYINVDEQLRDENGKRLGLKEFSWYHGRCNRDEVETLLQSQEEGSFLVRESSSCPKTVVISAIFGGVCQHYQIFRESFCIFYLDDNYQPFIGLDTLLSFLRSSDIGNILPKKLSSFVPGKLAPFEYLSQTPNLLLHEQCEIGDVRSVRAILCSPQFDKCSLNWRNSVGQTPLHLAATHGHTEILRMLINSGCFLENINSNGDTPLHVACESGHFAAVTALIQHGASVNKFSFKTKSTPLHICASKGFYRIFEWLSQSGAALFTVNADRKTPLELAVANGHSDIVDCIVKFSYPVPKFKLKEFLHPNLSRFQANDILKDHGFSEGLFLVRGSKRCLGPVLSLVWNKSLQNYEIHKRIFQLNDKDVEMFAVDDSPYFPDLEQLVTHFSSHSSLASFRLTHPVAPILREPLRIEIGGGGHRGESDQFNFSNAVLIGPDELTLGRTLGQGAYGEVVEGIWNKKGSMSCSPHYDSSTSTPCDPPSNPAAAAPSPCTTAVNVAVKKIVSMKDTNCQLDFLSEVRALFSIHHPGIVKLLGICFGPPVMLVTELVNGGSLLEHLIDNGESITIQQMVCWCAQIARPMAYLESCKLIHRDLAARNILLKSYKMCKICDFGLSRMVGEGKEYYVATKGGKWPLRWYAPESVNRWHFSSASDVWSFGITMHEIFSYGAQPYGDLTWEEVFDLIDEGQRLSQPAGCPDVVHQIMMSCWEYNPQDRPTFAELADIFMSPDFLSAFAVSTSSIINPLSSPSPSEGQEKIPSLPLPPVSTANSAERNSRSEQHLSVGGEASAIPVSSPYGSSGYSSSDIKYVETTASDPSTLNFDTKIVPPKFESFGRKAADTSKLSSPLEASDEGDLQHCIVRPPQKVTNENLARIKRPSKVV